MSCVFILGDWNKGSSTVYGYVLINVLIAACYICAHAIVSDNTSATFVGLSEMGFIFEETNQLNLQFVIPKHSNDGDTFPDVELWVFPDKSQVSRDTLLEIRYVAKADIPEASSPRMHQSLQLWDTNEDCIALNLTILSKKIYKVLQKRSLKESNVSVTIEITNVKESTRNHTADALHHDLCTSLSQRGSNQSFLIIKNYADQSIHRLFDAENLEANTSSVKKREAINDIANNSTASDSCRVVSLIVNLTEVYGDFIKAPVMTDIKDCSGECTSYKRNLFSKHAEIKERLKLLPGGSQLSEFEPSCVPLRYRPLNVHISLRNKPSYVIVQLPDLIVDKCACQ